MNIFFYQLSLALHYYIKIALHLPKFLPTIFSDRLLFPVVLPLVFGFKSFEPFNLLTPRSD